MKTLRFLAIIFFAFTQFGFSGVSTAPVMSLSTQAGFYELERIPFSLQNFGPKMELTSSKARIFYVFHPAERMPSRKPLFVFFNGGPGCPTSAYFMAMNTAPFTLDKTRTGGALIKANPISWSQMGNLLYIDAPNTGFSYNLMDKPSDPWLRKAEFDAQNFNPFIDAAQMTRVILRFLADHPELQDNPVILAGESYAGTRTTTILNLLLYYPAYGDGSMVYKDTALTAEIQKHLDIIFPAEKGKKQTPAGVARQFGHQVLIEPQLTGEYQTDLEADMLERKDSPAYAFAKQINKKFISCVEGAPGLEGQPCNPILNAVLFFYTNNRDPYAFTSPAGYPDSIAENAAKNMLKLDILSQMVGQDITTIPELTPQARRQSYRYQTTQEEDLRFFPTDFVPPEVPAIPKGNFSSWGCPDEAGQAGRLAQTGSSGDTLENALGLLKEWDDYYVTCSRSIYIAFYINKATKAGYPIHPESPLFGKMFLSNLPFVKTLITDAVLDLAVYSASIPESFKKYTDLVAGVQFKRGSDTQHDGLITITYKSGALKAAPAVKTRTIYYPYYGKSGHTVSLFQPEDLFNDVREWLTWTDQ